ncbi:MAG: hypothetical protein YK1309IOTA_2050003 [Marine Group I thaumarchaeote]|nr:MAG: hypothetical protein YK1309IOTA_2050003 [Marine Group I thaumarchaeote]
MWILAFFCLIDVLSLKILSFYTNFEIETMNRSDLLELQILAREEFLTVVSSVGFNHKNQFFRDVLRADCKIVELLGSNRNSFLH